MPKNVITDSEILLADYITSKKYKEKLRLVKFYDEKEGREFAFLTNGKIPFLLHNYETIVT